MIISTRPAVVMLAALLYLSFFNDASRLLPFVVLVSLVTLHFCTIFALLSLVLEINQEMHIRTVTDLKEILVSLKTEVNERDCRYGGGEGGGADTTKTKFLISNIKNYLRSLEVKPRLVGKLLGAKITPKIIYRVSGAVFVTLFSAILRVGLTK